VEYKTLERDWTIDFQPDLEGELEHGEIEVRSDFGSDVEGEYGAGAMTTLITRTAAGGQTSKRIETASASASAAGAHARIVYPKEGSTASFDFTKDSVVIGRGGKSFWVDLKLEGPADISREHCRIRRDPATNRFYIKDLSQFGTTVDGRPVPCSLERDSDEQRDRNIEVELPPRATIGLAGVVDLEFEAGEPV
jgi:hypothetical protein